jgi:hypothetical protein
MREACTGNGVIARMLLAGLAFAGRPESGKRAAGGCTSYVGRGRLVPPRAHR